MKVMFALGISLFGIILITCRAEPNEGEGHGEVPVDISSIVRTLRDVTESHIRLKRACSWWFNWKVTGAQVDQVEVTKELDALFARICNTYGR